MLPPTRLLLPLFTLLPAPGWAAPFCASGPVIELSLGNCSVRIDGQSDVHSWGWSVDIVGADTLCVVPSTVVSTTFLMTANICNGTERTNLDNITLTAQQCRSRRGGFITEDHAQDLLDAPIDGLAAANPNWENFSNRITKAAHATFKLVDDAVTMVVGFISAGQKSTASHLGLAKGSIFLQTLKDQGLIAARSFALDVGSQSTEFPRRGSLVLGGYDRGSYAASSYREFSVGDKVGERFCPLQVPVTQITMTGTRIDPTTGKEKTTSSVVQTRSSNSLFCLEPYDNLFRLTSVKAVKDWFTELTGWNNASATVQQYSKNVVDIEPGLVFTAKAPAFDGSMTIVINGSMIVEIPFYELWRPLRGLNADGEYELDNEYNELQIYATEGDNDAPVLGKAFLSQVYLFVDYEAQPPTFRLTPRGEGVTPTGAVSSAPCPAEDLRPADKGLIGVGSVLGALILALAGYVVYRYCPWVICCWSRAGKGEQGEDKPTPEPVGTQTEADTGRTPHDGGGNWPKGTGGTTGRDGAETNPVVLSKDPSINYR